MLIRAGRDVRGACSELGISRATLYRYFDDFPAYRKEIDEAMELAQKEFKEQEEKSAAEKWAEMKRIALRKRE